MKHLQPRRVSVLLCVLLCALHRLTSSTKLNGSLIESQICSGCEEDFEEVTAKTWHMEENDVDTGAEAPVRAPYPADVFSVEERRRGWVLLHVMGMLYMFVSLAFVSHEFFIPALGVVTEKLSISDDVAGATVMAAGRSAPKLFTSLIAVFINKGVVGFGKVVGSSVYNILFIVGVCGLLSHNPPRLAWWPMMRDMTFFTLNLILLLLFFLDNVIVWWESLLLVLSYISYLVSMKCNSQIEQALRCKAGPLERLQNNIVAEFEGELQNTGMIDEKKTVCNHEEKEERKEEWLSLKWPGTPRKQVIYLLLLPVSFPLWLTVPDVHSQKSRKFFAATFLGSIIWITVFSYFLVWWSHTVGETFAIPPEIMALTVLALGTSVPDVVTSVIVARRGCGDMVVSGSVGNNIFNVAVGLPLPCLLYSASHGLTPATVSTAGLLCAVALLILVLVLFVAAVLCCKWKLCKPLGAILLLLYLMFVGICVALDYEVIACPL
ncbi:sodium/potassium/calcium exchanger 2-like [Synchiropus splendidus]|uniref:sodium/potassium/calcium exchanger 2-like n=1 Tax=Synchiropus splendidus TaxID=270530 RepID=UPI00237EA788|nr:sodium/potassium/calcium exchanger 2-like [Synchiropus splendidus]